MLEATVKKDWKHRVFTEGNNYREGIRSAREPEIRLCTLIKTFPLLEKRIEVARFEPARSLLIRYVILYRRAAVWRDAAR